MLPPLIGALLLAACGGGGDTTSSEGDGKPKSGGTLTVARESEANGYNLMRDTAHPMVIFSVYDPLLVKDLDEEIRPYLAESLKSNDALTEWTIKLRPNVKFHDGTPFNADALRQIVDIQKSPASRTAAAYMVVDSLTVVDELTAVYKMKSPNAGFPGLLADIYSVPFSPTAFNAKGAEYGNTPVGTGPFVLETWQRDSLLVLKKNPNYWRPGLPYLDQVNFKPIPDEDARLAALNAGDMDAIFTVRQAQNVKKAAEGGAVKNYPDIGNITASTLFNMGRPPTDDKRVRRALGYALKQEDLIAVQGLEGVAPVVTQLFAKQSPFYSEDAAKRYAMNNVTEAKKLMNEYINDPNRSDGKPVGTRVNLGVFTATAGVATLNDLVVLYQQKWRDVGADIELGLVDQAVLSSKSVGKPPDFKADFDVTLSRSGSNEDPDNYLYNYLYNPKGGSNTVDMDNAELRRLLDLGRTIKGDEREKVYQQVSALLAEEMPFIFHGALATAVGAKPEVKNLSELSFPEGGVKAKGHPSAQIKFTEVWLDR